MRNSATLTAIKTGSSKLIFIPIQERLKPHLTTAVYTGETLSLKYQLPPSRFESADNLLFRYLFAFDPITVQTGILPINYFHNSFGLPIRNWK